MTRHKSTVRLRHMLGYAREVISLTQGKSRLDIENDRLLNLALVRLLEIIGEAANQISENERSRYPEIPWLQIIGLRNRLIHGYDAVDFASFDFCTGKDCSSRTEIMNKVIPRLKPEDIQACTVYAYIPGMNGLGNSVK